MTAPFDIAIEAAHDLVDRANKHTRNELKVDSLHEAADFLLVAVEAASNDEHKSMISQLHSFIQLEIAKLKQVGTTILDTVEADVSAIRRLEGECLDDLAAKHHQILTEEALRR